jgi:hypothetical protein
MFNHVNLDHKLQELECETLPTGRTYTTPEGKKYPSVTTVLGDETKAGIVAWQKRVGEDVAATILTQAGNRGSAVHDLAEKYVNNDPKWSSGAMPANVFSFNQIKPILDKNMDNVYAQEVPLYSDQLQTAGRVDLIAEWDGQLSIIDFKTALRTKKLEYVQNYFIQTAFYAAAFYERTGIAIKQGVVLITVDGEESQLFVTKTHDYIPHFIALRKRYKEKHGF